MGEEEDDPDWLRVFQAPSATVVTLSSSSDSSPANSPKRTGTSREDSKRGKKTSSDQTDGRDDAAEKGKKPTAARRKTPTSKKDGPSKQEGPSTEEKQDRPPTKTDTDQTDDALEQQEEGLAEEDIEDRLMGNSVSQRLPLVFPDKVQRSKALIECDGDSIDLSGDIGAVGRIVISNGPTGDQELLLDLKGTIYKSTIVPSRTFCVVSVGQTEAKVEAIMNDFIQLEPQSNLFEAETMMEGTLDGFTFDSEDEGDKLPESYANQNDQNNEDEDQPKATTKRKAEKPVGKGQKKAKVAGKPAKKGARKTQATKRTKKAKK